MITGTELEYIVYSYWAKRFGCAQENFTNSGTLVIYDEGLAVAGTILIYHIDKMSVVRVDPTLAEQMGLLGGYDREAGSLTVSEIRSLAGDRFAFEEQSPFWDCYLDPTDFMPFSTGGDYTARRVMPNMRIRRYLHSMMRTLKRIWMTWNVEDAGFLRQSVHKNLCHP